MRYIAYNKLPDEAQSDHSVTEKEKLEMIKSTKILCHYLSIQKIFATCRSQGTAVFI